MDSGKDTKFWVSASLFSFVIVAIVGTVMRYKIAFDLPFFNQRNLQHAHSHFAFTGWVTQLLMTYIVHNMSAVKTDNNLGQYKYILIFNYLSAIGMLIFFTIYGYQLPSIIFSTMSIFVFYWFLVRIFNDTKNIHTWSAKYLRSSLIFGLISTLGTFVLAYNMATKNYDQNTYLTSVYWYLHFQYNGWFLFGCLGLFHNALEESGIQYRFQNVVYYILILSCIPAFGLSVLWLNIPAVLYFIIVIAAVIQMLAWIIFFSQTIPVIRSHHNFSSFQKYLFLFIGVSIFIKITLQFISVHPELSKLAFGYRNIVIAYIHLSLLAFTSMFLIAYGVLKKFISTEKISKFAIWGIMCTIGITEMILGVQGVLSLSYHALPHTGILLFIFSGVLTLFALLLFYSSRNIKV